MAPPAPITATSSATAQAGYVQTVGTKSLGLADDVATRRTVAVIGSKALESAGKNVSAKAIGGSLGVAATAYTEINNTANVRSWLEEQGVEGSALNKATVQAGVENGAKATVATLGSTVLASTAAGAIGGPGGAVAGFVVGVGSYVALREGAERMAPTTGETVAQRSGIELPAQTASA